MAFNVRELQITVGSDSKIRVVQIPKKGVSFGNPELKLSGLQQETIEVFIEMLRQNRLKEHKEFQALGHNLYNVLFDNAIGKELTNYLQGGDSDQTYSFLRIMLAFEDTQKYLESWPWEYLFCPTIGTFLSMRADVILTRYIELADIPTARSLHVDKPFLNILFIAASPKDLEPVQYLGVLKTLRELEKQTSLKGRIVVASLITPHETFSSDEQISQDSSGQATIQAFVDSLKQIQPHIIHFIGHGRYTDKGGELAFVDTDNTQHWLHESSLATWLGPIHSLRLVFLQACETASTSQNPYAISGVAHHLAYLNIPAIIAMKYGVDNQSSNVFARYFYEALAKGKDVDVAVQEGREKVLLNFNDDRSYAFGLPTLYLRDTGGLLAPVTELQVVNNRKKKKA